MKKILLIFALIIGCAFAANADVFKYKSTAISMRTLNDNGRWSNWSDWEDCSVLVVINIDKDQINIYSAEPQEFDIYEAGDGFERDAGNGETWTLKCVDADGLRCEVRIRVQDDGQCQLYVDYSDLSYVYNIEAK